VIRVLIAEDQNLLREALTSILSHEEDIEVVAEVARGDQVVGPPGPRSPTSRCSTSSCPAPTGWS
jgi:two-component system, NarL family, response regulator DesR